jgi:hypothetical protein
MSRTQWSRSLGGSCFSILIFITIAGCATETLSKKAIPQEEPQLLDEIKETEISLYYDFKDVPVPQGLEVKREKSFVFQTTEYSIGFLTFSGKMEPEVIINYFTDRMPEDGWRFISSFKSPKNIIFFLKENRFCIITITTRTFAADVEILVTPSFKSSS